jgi:hypothetical protein
MSTPISTPLTENEVRARLASAHSRLSELLDLNGGNLPGADAEQRLQLIQEFFFHLVGSIDVLSQLVNEQREDSKGRKGHISPEHVKVRDVANILSAADPIKPILASLYTNPSNGPMPADPYGEEGYIYRIYNYRHQVTHRHRNPLLFRMPARDTALLLDPRYPSHGGSAKLAQEELQHMLELVRERCEQILGEM